MSSTSYVIRVLLHLLLLAPSFAQVGVDVCACAPVQWTFTVDLTSTCPEAAPATTDISCAFQLEGPDPVVLGLVNVTVLELDQTTVPISLFRQDGLNDGDSFNYASIVSGGITDPTMVPRLIQTFVEGSSAAGQAIRRVSSFTLNNECTEFPALTSVGSETLAFLGLVGTSTQDPSTSICTAAPAPSNNPSIAPSDKPSVTPSSTPSTVPSHEPSVSPSEAPSASPSFTPSVSPSNEPSTLPTDEPSISLSGSPSETPSEAPSETPSTIPSDPPSSNPSNLPSLHPMQTTKRPTPKPTSRPTPKPTSKPTNKPTPKPTNKPTSKPTNKPTPKPTNKPTPKPTNKPTPKPTNKPTSKPTRMPKSSPSYKGSGAGYAQPSSKKYFDAWKYQSVPQQMGKKEISWSGSRPKVYKGPMKNKKKRTSSSNSKPNMHYKQKQSKEGMWQMKKMW